MILTFPAFHAMHDVIKIERLKGELMRIDALAPQHEIYEP